MTKLYALSIKQPWAALLVAGIKTVEIRRWPTNRRGRILIHAARIPDPRPEAWALVPDELRSERSRARRTRLGVAPFRVVFKLDSSVPERRYVV